MGNGECPRRRPVVPTLPKARREECYFAAGDCELNQRERTHHGRQSERGMLPILSERWHALHHVGAQFVEMDQSIVVRVGGAL